MSVSPGSFSSDCLCSLYRMQSLTVRCLSLLHRAVPGCRISSVTSPFMRLLHMMPVISREVIKKPILQPAPTLVVQSCGMKQKGKLTLRCDDCYFVMRKGQLYVIFQNNPRDKKQWNAEKGKEYLDFDTCNTVTKQTLVDVYSKDDTSCM
ncbi:39S ribosomal protein L36, mitochondrial-like isoform X2 [Penaeus monodon]|uniref:39S ribosomal protein L36, mitochondrial-like isoform X2 n=1 Tax=Penaeus monodon TaxID=6687 RepID=UPI0018A7D39F|nr:39S ribosomal protein L36, mitochondrial-like isoform X2 [Penaeus monodon]